MIHYYNKQQTNIEIIGPITRDVLAAEKWKRCFKFPCYEISTVGRARRAYSGVLVKPRRDGKGYLSVNLVQPHEGQKSVKLARLMTDAFFKRQDGYNIDHINRNRSLNALFNLRYVTASTNQRNREDNIYVEWNGKELDLMSAVESVFGSSNKNRYQYIRKYLKLGMSFTDAAIKRAQYEAKKAKRNA